MYRITYDDRNGHKITEEVVMHDLVSKACRHARERVIAAKKNGSWRENATTFSIYKLADANGNWKFYKQYKVPGWGDRMSHGGYVPASTFDAEPAHPKITPEQLKDQADDVLDAIKVKEPE
jgi:hypothetical protein